MELALADPKGLVRESYAIEGITDGECRSIFIDWVLSLAAGLDQAEALRVLLAHYGAGTKDGPHPMTTILQGALLAPTDAPRRRGGRLGRQAAGL